MYQNIRAGTFFVVVGLLVDKDIIGHLSLKQTTTIGFTGRCPFFFNTFYMDNQIKVFNYNGSNISFDKGDGVMVNATEMAKVFGKRCNDFLSTKQTKELINSLSAKTGIPATGLVIVNQGGNNQGTWMHEDLALIFAQWLSPDFYL